MVTKYIRNEEHYSKVLKSLTDVRRELWIATSDIKDIYMRDGIPLLGKLAKLIERGVCVRLIHAKEPGINFRNDFDRYPILATILERLLCPRVHSAINQFDSLWMGATCLNCGRKRYCSDGVG